MLHIKLNTDGSMGGSTDPLNEDLSQVDPSFPLFAAGQVLEWKVTESAVKKSDDATKADRIAVTCESMSDATSVDGQRLPAGSKVFLGAQLSPTGKSTLDIVKKSVAGLLETVLGKDPNARKGMTLGNVAEWAPRLNGQIFRAKVKHRPGKDAKTYQELVRV